MSRSSQRRSRPASRNPVRSRPGSAPGALPDDPRATALAERLRAVSLRDEDRLRRRLAGLARRPVDLEQELPGLEEQTATAERRVAARGGERSRPALPGAAARQPGKDDLAAAISANQVVIVAGETGSGKSTQLPKICLQIGRGVRGTIGHTQPRRIAAQGAGRTDRRGDRDDGGRRRRLRDQVRRSHRSGHPGQVDDRRHPAQRDRPATGCCGRYDTIIIDEAHERSLNIDFLLGYLQAAAAAPARPEVDHHLGNHRPATVLPAFR